MAGEIVELPQFIPQRSPVHIARLMEVISDCMKVRERSDRQDGLSVVGSTVAFGSEVLYVTKGFIAGRILVVRGKPLVLDLLEPVRLVLARTSFT